MKIDWLDMSLLSFTGCTSLICLDWDSTTSSHCLRSAASVKVKWDEIWILNFYWRLSLETPAACLNEKARKEDRELRDWGRAWSNMEANLHSWECSRPCRRGICIHPSTPRRPAGHCAWRSNLCHCCRASWCARCGPPWHMARLPYFLHTATPSQQQDRESLVQSNVNFHWHSVPKLFLKWAHIKRMLADASLPLYGCRGN